MNNSKWLLLRNCFLAMLSFSSCDSTLSEEYYIPCNYKGWVNIIYNLNGASRVIVCDNKRVFFLSGNLINCYVNVSPEDGSFTTSYYRYCDDSIVEMKSNVRYKTFVPVRYNTTLFIKGKNYLVESFYVSDHPMSEALPDSVIPKNPLKNFIPAKVF